MMSTFLIRVCCKFMHSFYFLLFDRINNITPVSFWMYLVYFMVAKNLYWDMQSLSEKGYIMYCNPLYSLSFYYHTRIIVLVTFYVSLSCQLFYNLYTFYAEHSTKFISILEYLCLHLAFSSLFYLFICFPSTSYVLCLRFCHIFIYITFDMKTLSCSKQ